MPDLPKSDRSEPGLRRRWIWPTAAVVVAAAVASAIGHGPENPPELGRVAWGRDLDAALTTAKAGDRPVLLLFQEIPGCAGCRDFGSGPLSHPLLVEAIETEFVPLAIYNNRPGRDDQIRRQYDEPSWNYPVMRFLDHAGKDILPRRDRVWATGDVAARLTTALEKAGRAVPGYLRLAAAETAPAAPDKATFAMHCYWDGEAGLGGLDGVLATRAGWVGRREVVEVRFDPKVLPYRSLVRKASQLGCASTVYAHSDDQLRAAKPLVGSSVERLDGAARDAKASDQKFALNRSPFRYLPLTPMQASRVNADLRAGRNPARWLSPRQLELQRRIEKAVAAAPDALRSFSPPPRLDQLAAYEQKLRTALADS